MPIFIQLLVNILLLTGFISMVLYITALKRGPARTFWSAFIVVLGCGLAVLDTYMVLSSGNPVPLLAQLLYNLVLYNMPTIVCSLLYAVIRRRVSREQEMEKMRAQDLD